MSCVRISLRLAVLAAAVCLAGGVRAEPPAKPAKGEKFSTVTYDVADLVRNAAAWRSAAQRQPVFPRPRQGAAAAEALVEVVQRSVSPESWRADREGGSTLRLFNGNKLEVHATARQHAEIKDLLEALRRLTDVSVLFEAELYEIDRAFHKKHVETLFAGETSAARRLALPVKDAVRDLLRKQTKPLQWDKVPVLVGKHATLFSLRTAFTYRARPKTAANGDAHRTAFHGVSSRARVGVSADRRFVRLRLTQTATELVDFRQDTVFDPVTEKRVTVEVPNLVTTTAAADVEVADGVLLLLPVKYRPRGARNKDRVWVLLLRPVIRIDEEERALRNNTK